MHPRAIIIDDEKRSRETISHLIGMYCPEVQVIAEAGSITDAQTLIDETHPDILFLDIEMPGGSGFDLLRKYENPDFHVIFITAYQEFAIKAFRFSAIDYLLKPIQSDELIAAINKVKKSLNKTDFKVSFDYFLQQYQQKQPNKQLVLKTFELIHVVTITDIIRCESDNNYTSFYLLDGKKIVVSTTIKEYEELLGPSDFFRVHQSHLINLTHIQHYDKRDGGSLVMKDNTHIPVAIRKKDALFALLMNR